MDCVQSNGMRLADEIAAGDAIGTTAIAKAKGLCPATIFRWVQKGLPGPDGSRIRLEALRRGRSWITSQAALQRFFRKLPVINTEPEEAAEPVNRSPHERSKAGDNVASQLKTRYGI